MTKHSMFAVLWFALAGGAFAAEPGDCADATDVKSKSRAYFEGSTLMVSLLTIEKQGEANFRPAFATPSGECVRERFTVGESPVAAVRYPFEKGEQTLHYRFVADGAEKREVLVLYDGLASLVAKKDAVFMVVEERAGAISYYAMFRDQPTYAALKPLVTGIFDGSAKPLAAVRWPKGAKEPVIEAYDSDRLK